MYLDSESLVVVCYVVIFRSFIVAPFKRYSKFTILRNFGVLNDATTNDQQIATNNYKLLRKISQRIRDISKIGKQLQMKYDSHFFII